MGQFQVTVPAAWHLAFCTQAAWGGHDSGLEYETFLSFPVPQGYSFFSRDNTSPGWVTNLAQLATLGHQLKVIDLGCISTDSQEEIIIPSTPAPGKAQNQSIPQARVRKAQNHYGC